MITEARTQYKTRCGSLSVTNRAAWLNSMRSHFRHRSECTQSAIAQTHTPAPSTSAFLNPTLRSEPLSSVNAAYKHRWNSLPFLLNQVRAPSKVRTPESLQWIRAIVALAEWVSPLLISQPALSATVVYTNRYKTSIEWLNLRVQVRAMLLIKKRETVLKLCYSMLHIRACVFVCVCTSLFSVQNR